MSERWATGQGPRSGPAIGVALKLAPRRVDVDPLSGEVAPDRAPGGPSPAGLAALEIALRLREAWHTTVTVATVGPAAAEPLLRDALAMGADSAIRIQAPRGEPGGAAQETPGTPQALAATAGALAAAFAGCPVVLCGDGSHDGGTGAVPALLAAHGGRAQALGLTHAEPAHEQGTVRAERRLDRGWRERLLVRAPMVLSVESTIARPRRASMAAVLAARGAEINVVPWAAADGAPARHDDGAATTAMIAMTVLPYRPRARVLKGPEGDTPLARVLSLLGSDGRREPPQRVDAEAPAAARHILDKLRGWGYL